ncbi:hypothetical protein BURKHO8Y_550001 [Burkholderia sp. 8Y]|nr:hypothetical protein BURKHO8Y_550001 [Burkholderia sp. 8Y]
MLLNVTKCYNLFVVSGGSEASVTAQQFAISQHSLTMSYPSIYC